MMKQTIIAATVSFFLFGCGAGDEPYKEVPKAVEQQAWQQFNTDELWLYVPSTADAPRYAVNMDPFFQGEEKIVKLQFVEEGLRVVEVDRDTTALGQPPRWNDVAPVLTIPGDYLDYRCAEDAYGECTRQEEVNSDANVLWDQKRYFHPRFKDLKGHEVNTIDLWYKNDNVRETATPRVVRWEMDAAKGVINVELERTFTVNRSAMSDYLNTGFNDLSFKTSFYYSLVKLDKIASKDYQPIRYASADDGVFGFFDSTFEKLDEQGAATDGSERAYLNRFNPGKSTIDYYLSDTFFNPENKLFLDVTLSSIEHINKVLAGTGVPPINLVNPDKGSGKQVGDLRVNMINLIDRPLANGLLGYGPSVANPLTGEIVKAHVNQYSGVIRTAVPRTWNSLVRHFNRGDLKSVGEVVTAGVTFEAVNNAVLTAEGGRTEFLADSDFQQVQDSLASMPRQIQKQGASATLVQPGVDSSLADFIKADEARIKRWSENNAFGEDAIWVSSTSKGLVSGIDYQDASLYLDDQKTRLKKWKELNSEQRSKISDAISAHMYRSTLVHELGHNLGLRHNFAGSTDKQNFYSVDEAKSLGLQHVPAYSSIMDYAASEFDELPIFGPYDRAALRFAYARQVEVPYGQPNDAGRQPTALLSLSDLDTAYLQNDYRVRFGQLTALKDHLKDGIPLSSWSNLDSSFNTALQDKKLALKSYAFCTDGNVSLNSDCKRFDEGTNLVEMMQFKRQSYLDSYERRNTREDKQTFRDDNLVDYTIGRMRTFSEVRDLLEDYKNIDWVFTQRFGIGIKQLAANPAYCNPQGSAESDYWFCDYSRAAVDAADFLLGVVARPDKVCEVKTGNGAIEQLPLTKLYSDVKSSLPKGKSFPASCFDADFTMALEQDSRGYQVLSETRDGVPLDSVSPNDPNHKYSNDRDVLGSWPDKLLAMKYLVQRSTDRWTDNGEAMALVDLPLVKERLIAQIRAMVLGEELPQWVSFVDKDGKEVYPFSPYRWETKRTLESLSPNLVLLNSYFGLPFDANTRLDKALLTQIEKWGKTDDVRFSDTARTLIDYVRLPAVTTDGLVGRQIEYKDARYQVSPRNVLASDAIKYYFNNTPIGDTKRIEESFNLVNSFQFGLRMRDVYGDMILATQTRDAFPFETRLNMVKVAHTINADMLTYLKDAWSTGQPYHATLKSLVISGAGFKLDGTTKTYTDGQLQLAWRTFDSIGSTIDQKYWELVTGWLPEWSAKIAARRVDPALSAEEKSFWRGERAVIAYVLAQTNNKGLQNELLSPLEALPR
ncbi:zinc-dependent metalloprotease [Aeromonas allosaccharophila]|uniref:zinc-dependent metalloprotease n=1 Tax=Aeromonas allosaccharophila TaxID=656 RepID=UPI003D247F53